MIQVLLTSFNLVAQLGPTLKLKVSAWPEVCTYIAWLEHHITLHGWNVTKHNMAGTSHNITWLECHIT